MRLCLKMGDVSLVYTSSREPREALREIGNEIVGVFEADGEAKQRAVAWRLGDGAADVFAGGDDQAFVAAP